MRRRPLIQIKELVSFDTTQPARGLANRPTEVGEAQPCRFMRLDELINIRDGPRVVRVSSPDGFGRGSIITPEAVLLDFELAGLSSRSVAYGIDFVVQALTLLAFFTIVGFLAIGSELGAIVVALVGLITIVLGYPTLMETFNNGRTLGRMAVGTRVVTIEGAPIRFRHAFVRSLLGIIDLLISAGAVAVTVSLLTKRGQRLGDLVAGTMVIRERTSRLSSGALQFWPPQYLAQWSHQVDTRALDGETYQVVRDFLSQPDLSVETQESMALTLSNLVSQRLPHAARTQQVPPRDYLMAIAAASQHRSGTQPPPPRPQGPRAANVPPPPVAGRAAPAPPPPGFPVRPPVQRPYPTVPPVADTPDVGTPAVPPAPIAPPPNDGGFTAPG